MKLPAFATLFCLILLPLSATTATAPQKHALDGSVAALEAGPQNADEELALSFVMEFGLGEDFAKALYAVDQGGDIPIIPEIVEVHDRCSFRVRPCKANTAPAGRVHQHGRCLVTVGFG